MNKKVIGISIIIFALIILTVAIVSMLNPKEKVVINEYLGELELISLMKRIPDSLNQSKNLVEGDITDDSKANLALDYIFVKGLGSVTTDSEKELWVVDRNKLNEIVNYIFGKNLDFSKITYEYDSYYVYIPEKQYSTDMQVYKFRTREYNENENYYISYIDCLETGANRLVELANPNVLDYTQDEVMYTYVFKYREVDGRKILLAFNLDVNESYYD